MREDVAMRCEVVRETLSALLDGEYQDVPAHRVDTHLESCGNCRNWLIGAAAQARQLTSVGVHRGPDLAGRILAAAGVAPVAAERRRRSWALAGRWRAALIIVGLFQVVVALAQISGTDFGMVSAHGHGATTGAHLLHESTAWLLALGGAMVAAGIWTAAAPGVAAITGVFALALVGYVAADAHTGQVTFARVASHLPVLAGLVFALLVVRKGSGVDDAGQVDRAGPAGPVPRPVRQPARRRAHLRPVNQSTTSTSSTTTRRRLAGSSRLRWVAVTGGSDDDAVTALAMAAGRGDTAALSAFVEATQHDVWRFVAYLCDGASADDLTQETYLRAIGAIERFAGRSSARTWLLAIARRTVADHIRYLKSRPRAADGADPGQLLDRTRPARGFEDLVEVTVMIAGLTGDQREALLLTQLFGLSYRDAAAVCDCPVGTIRSRVARARDALLADPELDHLTG